MSDPYLIAICPTFRRPRLIPNVLAMWEAQTWPVERRQLIIYDDAGTFDSQRGRGWTLASTEHREPSLGDKFRVMVEIAIARGADAVCLFEDDDVYLPHYLEAHAVTLFERKADISKPHEVYSNDRDGRGTYRTVNATGRFHGCWAFTTDAYEKTAGYPPGHNAGFDMELQGAFHRADMRAADTWLEHPIGYVYRWQTTGYPNGSGWGEPIYNATAKSHAECRVPGRIEAKMDEETAGYYEELA